MAHHIEVGSENQQPVEQRASRVTGHGFTSWRNPLAVNVVDVPSNRVRIARIRG